MDNHRKCTQPKAAGNSRKQPEIAKSGCSLSTFGYFGGVFGSFSHFWPSPTCCQFWPTLLPLAASPLLAIFFWTVKTAKSARSSRKQPTVAWASRGSDQKNSWVWFKFWLIHKIICFICSFPSWKLAPVITPSLWFCAQIIDWVLIVWGNYAGDGCSSWDRYLLTNWPQKMFF